MFHYYRIFNFLFKPDPGQAGGAGILIEWGCSAQVDKTVHAVRETPGIMRDGYFIPEESEGIFFAGNCELLSINDHTHTCASSPSRLKRAGFLVETLTIGPARQPLAISA